MTSKLIRTGVSGADPFILNDGGTYYMYATTPGAIAGFKCHASNDLVHWKVEGYCLTAEDSFGYKNFWAPEVVKHGGRYYMHYSARESGSELLRIGVAVSDSPAGPFRDAIPGPLLSLPGRSTIDAHCFRDDDGKNYLFFSMDCPTNIVNGVHTSQSMCIRLDDSLTKVEGEYVLVSTPDCPWETEHDDKWQWNEGPFVLKHAGKYYLTYSANGFTDASYSVWQAVGTSPMGPFTKVSAEEGNPIISGASMPYANGSGHHTFVRNGDELYAIYHVHGHESQISYAIARYLFADRASFADDKIVVNGPSNCLMWLPESVSGYRNLTRTAKIEVSGGQGETYLNDEILPYYAYNENAVYSKNGDITVTLKFDRAVSVRAIMIYNAPTVYSAFSKIDKIEFELAEKAVFMSKDYKNAVITDLEYPKVYLSETDEAEYKACAPAVAEFEEIKVSSIKITLSAGNKLINYNKDGSQNKTLALSEIVVLGVTL